MSNKISYAIFIIAVLIALGACVYALRAPKTTETPSPVMKNEFDMSEAEKVLHEYARRVQRGGPPTDSDFDAELNRWISENLSDILTPEAIKLVKNPGIYRRTTSNPHPGDIEILKAIKKSSSKIDFETKHYEEYTGEGNIAFFPTTFNVVKINDRFYINDIIIGRRQEVQ